MRHVTWLVRNFGLLGLWFLAATLMLLDYRADPYDPGLAGTDAYGHNGQRDPEVMLAISAAELAVLYVILRPWSYRRSWWRPLISLLPFAPWTLLNMVASMHAGGVAIVHWMWLLVVDVILVACFTVSAASVAWSRWMRGSG